MTESNDYVSSVSLMNPSYQIQYRRIAVSPGFFGALRKVGRYDDTNLAPAIPTISIVERVTNK